MKKNALDEVVKLTQDCLESFWKKDMDMLINYLAEDVVFVMAQQEQFRVGRADAIENLENIKSELQPCHMRNSEFYVASNDSRTSTIVGRYLVTTDDTAEFFLQAQQRCTFVWEKEGDDLKIKHCHISNPIGELQVNPGEHFVNKMGRMAKKYLDDQLSLLRDNRNITVTKENGGICFIYLSDIVYMEAIRKCTYIYTCDEEIHAKAALIDLIKELDEKFVRVHRSYIVNVDYVMSIAASKVIMTDGKEIPIPVKKFSNVKKELLQLHGIEG